MHCGKLIEIATPALRDRNDGVDLIYCRWVQKGATRNTKRETRND
jgi:DNA-binding NtrC family response regulator